MTHTTCLVATAKNEAPFLWEWVAYHKMIGFDRIILFQNDSDDGTHRMMQALDRAGIVEYHNNSGAATGQQQVRAYVRAGKLDSFQTADWAMALDLDEFLHVKTGNGTVQALIEALGEADCAAINWKLFGASGTRTLTDELVTQRFTMAEADERVRTRLTGFKSLFRTSVYSRPGVHRPNRR